MLCNNLRIDRTRPMLNGLLPNGGSVHVQFNSEATSSAYGAHLEHCCKAASLLVAVHGSDTHSSPLERMEKQKKEYSFYHRPQ